MKPNLLVRAICCKLFTAIRKNHKSILLYTQMNLNHKKTGKINFEEEHEFYILTGIGGV